MSTLTITLDDDAARLVEAAAQGANQPLEHWLRESICRLAEQAVNPAPPPAPRISPLHPGAMQAAPDFNEPLTLI